MTAVTDTTSRPILACCGDANETIESVQNVLSFIGLALPAIAEGSAVMDGREADGLRVILKTCASTLESLRPERNVAQR